MSNIALSNATRCANLSRLAARCGLATVAARYATLAARWNEVA